MKIIFSRKGFDSTYGKVASPIFPDGKILSFPIPSKQSNIRYDDIKFQAQSLVSLIYQLTRGRIKPEYKAHLDPDLRREALDRPRGWKPSLGQVGSAQGHLEKQGIKKGDLFLFYGWFHEVLYENNKWVYRYEAPDFHMIFGWMQIGEICPADPGLLQKHKWLAYHPHFHGVWNKNNTIYIATDYLNVGQTKTRLPGAYGFKCFHPELQLTASEKSRSVWSLPKWFYPKGRRCALTYNTNPENWEVFDDRVELKTKRGQEYVFDTSDYPEAINWLNRLFELL